ncbi:DNA polymerase III subunit delta' [Cohnella sp. GCM10012308]|uniref:DNA polymerase III subunit delta' n=1 Tax=Cohnella sp. GCM10012308 TaxID=3317329 RepID=UPI00361DE465
MTIASVPGQDRAKRLLQGMLRSGKVAHAYLFAGPQGSGRSAMAQAFAMTLLCERGGDDACGECLTCRKVQHGNHPDLHRVVPDGQTVKIDQIRELQRELSYRSAGSQRKIYVIEAAETMTVQAANSLLKFLEEPPSPVVAILIAPSEQAMLPTIVSRTQLVPFTPGDPKATEALLVSEGTPPLIAKSVVHLTAGFEAARVLAAENWFAEIRNVVIQLGREIPSRFPGVLLTAQTQVFKTDLAEHTDILLQLFALWYRDMIYVMTGREERLVFPDQAEWLSKQAWTRSVHAWTRSMEAALSAVRRIKANVQPQLAFEQFLVTSAQTAG